jgi:hypothetical protein
VPPHCPRGVYCIQRGGEDACDALPVRGFPQRAGE